MTENTNRPLIEVKDLKEYFPINTGLLRTRPLKAVDGVSFSINKGETLGLVGESGCGKTTVGRTSSRPGRTSVSSARRPPWSSRTPIPRSTRA